MKILKTLILLLVISFTSCTITQEFQFNKDFSGNTKLSIDMSSLIAMMAGMDSTGTKTKGMKDSLDFVFKESIVKLDSLGIKNIKYGWEEGTHIMFVSYDFDNIETLNKSLNASNQGNAAFSQAISKEPHKYFTLKGKNLSYKGPKSTNQLGNNADMESMKDYYKYVLIFNFERKIKKIDNPNVTLSGNNKKAELKGSMFEIIKPEYNSDINFKLK
jgi:hypothetical protein